MSPSLSCPGEVVSEACAVTVWCCHAYNRRRTITRDDIAARVTVEAARGA